MCATLINMFSADALFSARMCAKLHACGRVLGHGLYMAGSLSVHSIKACYADNGPWLDKPIGLIHHQGRSASPRASQSACMPCRQRRTSLIADQNFVRVYFWGWLPARVLTVRAHAVQARPCLLDTATGLTIIQRLEHSAALHGPMAIVARASVSLTISQCLEQSAALHGPMAIVARASPHTRRYDCSSMLKAVDRRSVYLLADMAHTSGLVATGRYDCSVKVVARRSACLLVGVARTSGLVAAGAPGCLCLAMLCT